MDEMMDGLGRDGWNDSSVKRTKGHDIGPRHKTKMYCLAATAPGEKVWNQTQNRSTLLEEVQWSSFVNGATSKTMTEIEGGYEGL